MTWDSVLNDVWNLAVTILTIMIPFILPPLLIKLLDKLGADADANRRNAFITAVVNGLVGFLASRGYKKGDEVPIAVQMEAAIAAADYAAKTVPDTIKKLGVDRTNLPDIAAKQLPQVLGQFGPIAAQIGAVLVEDKKA
jgi:hypothetical protein